MKDSKFSFRDLDRVARKRLTLERYVRFTEHARVAQHEYERYALREHPSKGMGRAIRALEAIRVAEIMGALARLLMEQRDSPP